MNGLAIAVSALNTVVVARYLGPTGRGQIVLVFIVATYLTVGGTLSIETGIHHFGTSGRSLSRIRRSALRAFAVVVPTVAAVLLVSLLLLTDTKVWVACVVSVAIASTTPATAVAALHRLAGRQHFATWFPVLFLLLEQVFASWACVVYRSVDASLLGAAIGALLAWSAVLPRARPLRALGSDQEGPPVSARELLGYSLKGHGGALLHLVLTRFPTLLAGLLIGANAAGLYSVGVAIVELPLILAQGAIAWLLSNTDPRGSARRLNEALLVTALASVLFLVVLCLTAQILVPHVVGDDFRESARLTWLLAPSIMFLTLWRVGAYYLAFTGHAAARTYSVVLGAIVFVPATVVLGLVFGLGGLAVGASLGWLAVLVALRARGTQL